ncbi:hypothetical protein M9H77_21014 [Catharanthus roseus]|uniref:Uncharacterized protein n=1 Tax=Catharanthus roseus TaxID=4058 RepID=A0ACC0ALT7_CATRO|nr:hypothetical protein M9H77_21014 [Catharanthus roseus]
MYPLLTTAESMRRLEKLKSKKLSSHGRKRSSKLKEGKVMCTSLKKLYLFEQNTATGLFKKRITNGNLSAIEFLRIESCHQLKGLFSPHSCKCLMNLNVLRVKDCSNLQEVISKEENIRQTKVDEIKFP